MYLPIYINIHSVACNPISWGIAILSGSPTHCSVSFGDATYHWTTRGLMTGKAGGKIIRRYLFMIDEHSIVSRLGWLMTVGKQYPLLISDLWAVLHKSTYKNFICTDATCYIVLGTKIKHGLTVAELEVLLPTFGGVRCGV